MSTIDDEVKVESVYGGNQSEITNNTSTGTTTTSSTTTGTATASSASTNLPVTRSFWSNMKAFWLQEIDLNQKIDWKREIKVELTPYQQKVENEINDFLHQEITWEKFRNFLTKPLFSSKK
ncbi:MAG: hypothetical protein IKF17_06240 [Clostridia bacterium]|nr:hypothetical protein [Clostridia bacterium]